MKTNKNISYNRGIFYRKRMDSRHTIPHLHKYHKWCNNLDWDLGLDVEIAWGDMDANTYVVGKYSKD